MKQANWDQSDVYFVQSIPIEFNYEVREDVIMYRDLGEIFTDLGGISASLGVIFG